MQIDSLGEAVLLMCIFAVALLAALELGYRGARREERRNEAEKKQPHRGTGTVEAAVLGLLGLILAFGLSGSQSRYDDQRKLLVERVNAIADAHDLTIVLPPTSERASARCFADTSTNRSPVQPPAAIRRRSVIVTVSELPPWSARS